MQSIGFAPGKINKLRQHRTIAAAGFDGSFPPQIRCENLEIHKVFRRFRNKFVMQNSTPNLLAELCGIALKIKHSAAAEKMTLPQR